ncbi:MAG: DUF4861 family protein [Verrucomicrobiota bacterium]
MKQLAGQYERTKKVLSKRRRDLANFTGVTLPEHFLPAAPRAFARFVPERSDDFAWENDLVAFRAYGPALRHGPENSGIDCWFKRVPYPIIDKWYLEDRVKLPYGKATKSYHQDHGEGYDGYKVGDSRGCGGISLWADGQLQNSKTFVAQRLIENTPQRVTFELDYSSDWNGKALRETKRITLVMGQRLYQCDARFTLDGAPAKFEVGIGLMPQEKASQAVFSQKSGIMQIWEMHEGFGLGTGMIIDPSRVVDMIHHTDPSGQSQALCIAHTDANGSIRWFAGFAWQGQGQITSAQQWNTYLTGFTTQFPGFHW